MYIVLVPVLGIFFHKKTGIRVWISVALAVCGLYLLCMTGGSFRLQRGDLYTLCCALMFSLQILAVDHYAPIADNAILACIEFFTCGICSLIPMFLLEQPRIHLILAAWLPILYAGILSNGVAYTLQFFAQRGLPASTASLLMSTESVFSLLAGFLILHQTTDELVSAVMANPDAQKALEIRRAQNIQKQNENLPKMTASQGMTNAAAVPEHRPQTKEELFSNVDKYWGR